MDLEKREKFVRELVAKPPVTIVKTLVNDRECPRLNAKEVLGILGDKDNVLRMYEAVKNVSLVPGMDRPMTLTAAFGEMLGPAEGEEKGLNGLERLLRALGIPVRNDIENGVFAGTMDLFFASPTGTALVPEYINQTLRQVAQATWNMQGLIAETIPTPNGTYEQPYIDLSKLKTNLAPVGEGAEFQEITLGFTSLTGHVHKRGCSFLVSYEAIRRMPISIVQLALQRIGYQVAIDTAGALIAAMNTAAGAGSQKSAYLQPGTTDANDSHNILYTTWMNFIANNSGRVYSKVVGNQQTTIAVLSMVRGGLDVMTALNLLRAERPGMGTISGIQNDQWGVVDHVIHPDVADWTLFGVDPRFAMLQIVETGADITETEKVISRQLNRLVVSMATDYCAFDASSIRKMTNI